MVLIQVGGFTVLVLLTLVVVACYVNNHCKLEESFQNPTQTNKLLSNTPYSSVYDIWKKNTFMQTIAKQPKSWIGDMMSTNNVLTERVSISSGVYNQQAVVVFNQIKALHWEELILNAIEVNKRLSTPNPITKFSPIFVTGDNKYNDILGTRLQNSVRIISGTSNNYIGLIRLSDASGSYSRNALIIQTLLRGYASLFSNDDIYKMHQNDFEPRILDYEYLKSTYAQLNVTFTDQAGVKRSTDYNSSVIYVMNLLTQNLINTIDIMRGNELSTNSSTFDATLHAATMMNVVGLIGLAQRRLNAIDSIINSIHSTLPFTVTY